MKKIILSIVILFFTASAFAVGDPIDCLYLLAKQNEKARFLRSPYELHEFYAKARKDELDSMQLSKAMDQTLNDMEFRAYSSLFTSRECDKVFSDLQSAVNEAVRADAEQQLINDQTNEHNKNSNQLKQIYKYIAGTP